MRASHPRRSQSALSPCRSGGQFSRRPTPSATSALLSRMTGSMNPALASASTWTDEMSRRIDSLPSRRRVRRILTPAGRRVPSRLRGASRIRRRGQGAPMHQPSVLTGADPLSLVESDPVIAHEFVIDTRGPPTLRQRREVIPLFDRKDHSFVPTCVPRDLASAGGQ